VAHYWDAEVSVGYFLSGLVDYFFDFFLRSSFISFMGLKFMGFFFFHKVFSFFGFFSMVFYFGILCFLRVECWLMRCFVVWYYFGIGIGDVSFVLMALELVL